MKTNSIETFDSIIEDKTLKKSYRKIGPRSNLGLAEQIFMYQASHSDGLRFGMYDTWSACFERVQSSLEASEATTLEICVLTADTAHLDRAFSFIHKIFLLSHDRLQGAYSTPSEVLTRIIKSKWQSIYGATINLNPVLHPARQFLPLWQPKLPSHRTEPNLYTNSMLKLTRNDRKLPTGNGR